MIVIFGMVVCVIKCDKGDIQVLVKLCKILLVFQEFWEVNDCYCVCIMGFMNNNVSFVNLIKSVVEKVFFFEIDVL